MRPRLRSYTLLELRGPMLLGVVTAITTVAFLSAIERIPLGPAVAIEFLGPLGVAVARSHHRRNLVWPVLALAGVLAADRAVDRRRRRTRPALRGDRRAGWAAYILLTQSVGDRFSGIEGLAISIPVAAVGLGDRRCPPGDRARSRPSSLLQCLGLAVLLPVIPFALEMMALRRLTTAAFGTLMALEPAIGTAIGVLVLSQVPHVLQVLGVVLVVVAGIGAERSGHRRPPPVQVL